MIEILIPDDHELIDLTSHRNTVFYLRELCKTPCLLFCGIKGLILEAVDKRGAAFVDCFSDH